MPIDDRFQTPLSSPHAVPGNSAYEGRGMSPSLSEQTPGMDKTSRIRNMAMRPVSYVRERPGISLSILGGLIVLGIGTYLALRPRRRTRWEMMMDYARGYGTDAYDWMRSKL